MKPFDSTRNIALYAGFFRLSALAVAVNFKNKKSYNKAQYVSCFLDTAR